MIPARLWMIVLGVLSAILFITIPVALVRRLSWSRPRRRTMRHLGKAVEALKDYTAEQRDEATGRAKATIDDLDERIDMMEQRIYGRWNEMDQESRERSKVTLDRLRKQRNTVAEWYGALTHGSIDAWNDVKRGFMQSYQDLNDSFQEALAELKSAAS